VAGSLTTITGREGKRILRRAARGMAAGAVMVSPRSDGNSGCELALAPPLRYKVARHR